MAENYAWPLGLAGYGPFRFERALLRLNLINLLC